MTAGGFEVHDPNAQSASTGKAAGTR